METLSILEAVILGLLQGLAEFLPISSSGHLAIMQHFFGIEGDSVLLFAVLLHLGTLVSVFIVYWKDISELVIELFKTIKDLCTGKGLCLEGNPTRRLGCLIVVATIPTGIIGLALKDLFESLYSSMLAIGCGLIFTGAILIIAERIGKGDKAVEEMKFRSAIFVGIMQSIAIMPGVSRSGSTLFGGLLTGQERVFAVKFAFLISIPAILGSFVLEVPSAISAGVTIEQMIPILVGMVVAAVSGYAAIKFMIKIVTKQKLIYFSLYTFVVGLCLLIYSV